MADSIEKSIEIAAPVSRVWKALTTAEDFGRWFKVKLEAPFVEGQEARGALLEPGYEHLIWRATIERIEPERLFSFRWHPAGIDASLDYSGEVPTRVEFTLEPIATGTRLVVRETGFEHLPADRRDSALRLNAQGWAIQVERIKAYVSQS